MTSEHFAARASVTAWSRYAAGRVPGTMIASRSSASARDFPLARPSGELAVCVVLSDACFVPVHQYDRPLAGYRARPALFMRRPLPTYKGPRLGC